MEGGGITEGQEEVFEVLGVFFAWIVMFSQIHKH